MCSIDPEPSASALNSAISCSFKPPEPKDLPEQNWLKMPHFLPHLLDERQHAFIVCHTSCSSILSSRRFSATASPNSLHGAAYTTNYDT